MKHSILWVSLLICGACKAPQSTVDRWRSELAERERADRERLETATERELWELTRARLSAELQAGRRQQQVARRRSRSAYGGVQGLYVFDVSDLVQGVRDYRAPIIGDLRRPEDRAEREEGYLRERQGAFSEDALLEMITGGLLAEDFEERGGSVTLVNGKLIIREP